MYRISDCTCCAGARDLHYDFNRKFSLAASLQCLEFNFPTLFPADSSLAWYGLHHLEPEFCERLSRMFPIKSGFSMDYTFADLENKWFDSIVPFVFDKKKHNRSKNNSRKRAILYYAWKELRNIDVSDNLVPIGTEVTVEFTVDECIRDVDLCCDGSVSINDADTSEFHEMTVFNVLNIDSTDFEQTHLLTESFCDFNPFPKEHSDKTNQILQYLNSSLKYTIGVYSANELFNENECFIPLRRYRRFVCTQFIGIVGYCRIRVFICGSECSVVDLPMGNYDRVLIYSDLPWSRLVDTKDYERLYEASSPYQFYIRLRNVIRYGTRVCYLRDPH